MNVSPTPVDRAVKLSERFLLARQQRPITPSPDADALMSQWAALWGGREALQRRLEGEGLDPNRAAASMIAPAVDAAARWLRDLQPVRAIASGTIADGVATFSRERHPRTLPYRRLWIPFLLHAVAGLDRTRLAALTTPAARASLEEQLLGDLARAGVRSAHFDARRAEAAGVSPVEWERALLASGYSDWLEQRPVLLRRLTETAEAWVGATNFMLECFERDAQRIAGCFGSTVRRIESIRPGLSDSHNHGTRVAFVRFDSGLELAWQPRDIGMLEGWNALLRGLDRLGMPDAPPAIGVLSLGDHGWVSWARVTEVDDALEARAWFRRAGSLLALLHVANGRDFHMDNVVATREGPVIVDAEALLQPQRIGESERETSPFATGFVNFPMRSASGEVREAGGLAGTGGMPIAGGATIWTEAAAGCSVETVPAVSGPTSNLPVTPFGAAEASPHVAEIESGFVAALRFILERRAVVGERILACFSGRTARIVLRPTEVYAAAIGLLTDPARNEDARNALAVLEPLLRPLMSDSASGLWALVQSEREAIERFDVPLFSVATDSIVVQAEDGSEAERVVSRSGLRVVMERLHTLDEDAIVTHASELRKRAGISDTARSLRELPLPDATVSDDQLVDATLEIAHGLAASSGALRRSAADAATLRAFYLDHGLSGAALLFAGLARVTGDRHWEKQAEETIAALVAMTEDPQLPSLVGQSDVGYSSGTAGLAYALLTIGDLLGSSRYAQAAERLGGALSISKIESTQELDLHEGVAGAVLGLASIAATHPGPQLVSLGRKAYDHLVARLSMATTIETLPSGFAHGLSGVALALHRWGAAMGDDAACRLARELFAAEARRWSPGMKNWATLTTSGASIDMRAWCNGSPGIAIARISGAGDGSKRELSWALDSVQATRLHPVDHVCCGNAGRVEALWSGYLASGDETLAVHARRRAAAMLTRRRLQGAWSIRLERDGESSTLPGFFKGASGIAWTFLRMATGGRLPSIAAGEMRSRRHVAEREIG